MRTCLSTGSKYVIWCLLRVVNTYAPQVWNGSFFDDATLTAAGLIVQLGHRFGDTCSAPSNLKDLMVFDISGVHRLVVRYCGCDRTLSKYRQLLRKRWFPAMINRPATAFSYNTLDLFSKLQDQSKCNPYDFYHSILRRWNPAGLKPEIVCPSSRAQFSH